MRNPNLPDPNDRPRRPRGQSDGGQFAPAANPESGLILPPAEVERRRLEREDAAIAEMEASFHDVDLPPLSAYGTDDDDDDDEVAEEVESPAPAQPQPAPAPTPAPDRRARIRRPEYDWGGVQYVGPVPYILGRETPDIEGSWNFPPKELMDVDRMARFWASAPIPEEALANIWNADRWGRNVKTWQRRRTDWSMNNPRPGKIFGGQTPEKLAWQEEYRKKSEELKAVRESRGFIGRGDLRAAARIGAYYHQMRGYDTSTWRIPVKPELKARLDAFWDEARRAVFLLDTGEPVEAEALVMRFHLWEIGPAYFGRWTYRRPY